MVFDKMAAIGFDFKWLGLLISDPVQNPDHLQTNLFLTILNLRPGQISDPHSISI